MNENAVFCNICILPVHYLDATFSIHFPSLDFQDNVSLYCHRIWGTHSIINISWKLNMWSEFYTQGQFWPFDIVVSYIRVCILACVNPELVHTITHHPFKLKPPNKKNQKIKQNTLVKIPVILQVDWPWPSKSNFPRFELVCVGGGWGLL